MYSFVLAASIEAVIVLMAFVVMAEIVAQTGFVRGMRVYGCMEWSSHNQLILGTNDGNVKRM